MSAVLSPTATTTALAPCPVHRGARWRRPVAWLLVLGGAGLVGTGALAAWQVTTNTTSGELNTIGGGVKVVDGAGSTFSAPVAGLVPGDYFYRYVDIENSGSAGAFTGTVTATGDLKGSLFAKVESCPTTWASGTCAQPTSLVSAPNLSTALGVVHGVIPAGQPQHLRYTFTLDQNAPDALQGKKDAIVITVSGAVRAGTDRTTS